MKLTRATLTIAIALLAWISPAYATPVTYDLSFSGSGFTCVEHPSPHCTPFSVAELARIVVDSSLLNHDIASSWEFAFGVPLACCTYPGVPPSARRERSL